MIALSKWAKKAKGTNMKFGNFQATFKINSNSFLYSALTICLLAFLAIAAEARHVKKTQNRGNAKMLSLIEKMNKQRVPDVFPAQVRHHVGENVTL